MIWRSLGQDGRDLQRWLRPNKSRSWDFQIQTVKLVMASLPDIVVVDNHQKTAMAVDVVIPSDSHIRRKKKEREKLEKYQGSKEELKNMWTVKAAVMPIVIGPLGAVTPPKLSGWLLQIPGTTSEISVQKSALLGAAKISQAPRPLRTRA